MSDPEYLIHMELLAMFWPIIFRDSANTTITTPTITPTVTTIITVSTAKIVSSMTVSTRELFQRRSNFDQLCVVWSNFYSKARFLSQGFSRE